MILVSSRVPCAADARATSLYETKAPQPWSAETLVNAAVSVVLPWSTWPIVPTLQWGLVRINFSLAMGLPRGLNPRAFWLHGPGHHESWFMPGAAFASGPTVDVLVETFGQARGKAGAVEGDRSLVICIRDDHARRIKLRFRWLLVSR